MRNYIGKNYQCVIDEEEILRFLTPQSRRKLIKCLVEFIAEEYHRTPTTENITTVCQATVGLFNSLKVENSTSGGIVSNVLFVVLFSSIIILEVFAIFI